MENTTALTRFQQPATQIDAIISSSSELISKNATTFFESLSIAKAVSDLKNIMLRSQEIKEVVMDMANNRMGFLTDRTPAIIAKNQRENKWPSRHYSYEELVDPIVEGLLKGYRISGNEINIISGQFYATKNGNSRMIFDNQSVKNFSYNNSPVELSDGGKKAKVRAWAKWIQDGKPVSIGVDADDELIIQVRVNSFMGEDAVIGKVHAKLFKRVLERITGRITPEASDIDVIDITPQPENQGRIGATEAMQKTMEANRQYREESERSQTEPPQASRNNDRNPIADNRPPDNYQPPPQGKTKFAEIVEIFGTQNAKAACAKFGFPFPPRDQNNPAIIKKIGDECEAMVYAESEQ